MKIIARHKESGLYLRNNSTGITFCADAADASDISAFADIFQDSDAIELVKISREAKA